MSDENYHELDKLADDLSNAMSVGSTTHAAAVKAGTALELHHGGPANFATAWVLSRLLNTGYVDAFSLSDHTWDRHEFAEEVRQYIEVETIETANLDGGRLGLELAFLAMNDVDWLTVGLMVREKMMERVAAFRLLRCDTIKPTLTTKKVNPEDVFDADGNLRFPG